MAPEPARATARFASLVALMLFLATPAHALRLVNYNILNYPGSSGPTRDPHYRTILAPLSPDVIVTGETTSQAGVTEFVNNLNVMEPGQWAAAPFVDGNDTDCGLFYKPAKVTFLGQWAFYPNPANLLRYVHVYRIKPVGYASDAAEIRLYGLHLKASTGFEAQRLAEATGIRDTMNALPPGTHAMVLGDFNFYTGFEPGFVKFLENQVDNDGRLYDPLGLQNLNWQDNTSIQYAWTQSPCKTGDTGCASGAATGGMDDRFDLILPTYAWQDGAGLELVPGSYRSVGNDGLHHNNSIMDAPTIPEGAAYALALHSVSDHLPVRVDLRLPAILSASTAPIAFGSVIVGATAAQDLAVTNGVAAPGEPLAYSYVAPAGFTAPAGTLNLAAGASQNDAIGLDTSSPGIKGGALALNSNALDSPTASITLSGTVLRHSVASLDSLIATGAGTLDFGTHDSTSFAPLDLRVHNLGYDALQARLSLASGTITGGNGRFSIVGGFTPALLADVGQTYTVAFDANGATPDSQYTATLSLGSADEALPGATPNAALDVTLRATKQGGGSTAVGDAPPVATRLYSPFPNPLRGASTVRFDVARAGEVAVEVFDVAGRRAATLLRGALEAGRYSVRWNGVADGGSHANAGLYFVRMTAPGAGSQTVRLAIVR